MKALLVLACMLCTFSHVAHADCENDCSIDFHDAIDSCCDDAEACEPEDPIHYNECTRAYARCTQNADRSYARCLAYCE